MPIISSVIIGLCVAYLVYVIATSFVGSRHKSQRTNPIKKLFKKMCSASAAEEAWVRTMAVMTIIVFLFWIVTFILASVLITIIVGQWWFAMGLVVGYIFTFGWMWFFFYLHLVGKELAADET